MPTVAETPINTKKLKNNILPVEGKPNIPEIIEPVQLEAFVEGKVLDRAGAEKVRRSVVNNLTHAGESLFLLKQNANWKHDREAAGCTTIDDYFRKVFSFSAQHAGRMLDYYEIDNSIEDPELRPQNEGQARLLKDVPVELRPEVMEKALEIAPKDPKRPKSPGKLTAEIIKQAKDLVVPVDPNAVVTDGRKLKTKQAPTQVANTVDTTVEDEDDPSNTKFSPDELAAIATITKFTPSKHYPGVYVMFQKLTDGSSSYEYVRLKMDVLKALTSSILEKQLKPVKPKAADEVLPSQADPTPEQVQIAEEKAADEAALATDPLAVE